MNTGFGVHTQNCQENLIFVCIGPYITTTLREIQTELHEISFG
jgi:hypothetical protein